MNKILFLFVIFGMFFSLYRNCFSALTKQDIQEIKMIIREELKLIEIRIDSLEKRIDSLEKRIDSLEKRIDSLEKRIEDFRAIMLAGFTILFSGMFCMIGFVIWDRRSALKPAITDIEELKKREAQLEEALRRIAYNDEKVASVLKSMNLL